MKTFPNGPKSEWQHQADLIGSGEIATTRDDIPMLLEWLKDINWPGAETISKHLPSYGESVGTGLGVVFESGDAIWTRWVLASLAESFDRQFWLMHKAAVRNIAFGRDVEGAAAEALYILARHDLDSHAVIRTAVIESKGVPGADPDDYARVEALL